MPQLLTCQLGHQWQSATANGRCPFCAAAEEFTSDEHPVEQFTLPDDLPPPPLRRWASHSGDAVAVTAAPNGRELPRVAGYEILVELGRGGMGVVYKARHLRLNRPVALKMILGGEHADPKQFERFLAEAEAVARLHHPNVVQIFEIGEADGLPYLALELVEGDSLQHRLRAGPLPGPAAAAVTETLARAVQHAHDRGIIHRDLKPANILLQVESRKVEGRKVEAAESSDFTTLPLADLRPKVTDFGIAKQIGGEGRTSTGVVIGTPSYMAPEQVAAVPALVGPGVDVYALGAILYEMLTGRPPFLATTTAETLRQVVHQEVVPPRRSQPTLPRDLETICLKCLRKEPQKRYASAGALAEDLRRFQAGEPIAARPVGHLERGWQWCRRNNTVAALTALAAGLLVAGTAVSLFYAIESGEREDRANRNADESRKNALRANANERTAEAHRYEAEQFLVEGVLLVVGGTDDPTDPEIRALGKLAAYPRDDVRVLFVQTAFGDPNSTAAFSRRADEALHAAVGLSAARRGSVTAVLLDRIRTDDRDETRLACVRAAGLLRDPDPALARATVDATLDALRTPQGKELIATDSAVEALAALVGHMTPADRTAAVRTARARLLDADGEERFAILASFVAALPPEEAAPLVKELAPRLTKAFASLAPPHDLRALDRAVRLLAARLPREDAAALAAAIAQCAVRPDLAPQAREREARRRALALILLRLLPHFRADEAAALAAKVLPLPVLQQALAAEEADGARVTAALAAFLPDDERTRAVAATTRIASLFSAGLGHKQQLLPVADCLIDLRDRLPERDAKRLVRECLQAIQNPNRDPHSFHAAVAVLAAHRGHLTAAEIERVSRVLIERKPEATNIPLPAPGARDRSDEAADEADLLAASAAFADVLPREYVESLRPVITAAVRESRKHANPRLRIATARALAALGPALRLDADAGAVALAHALLRERDGLSINNGHQRTDEGDLVLDAFCRLFPLFTDQQLVDLMKQPLCRRVERERAARELGRRHGQAFRGVWEMVAWAETHAPRLDLNSPAIPLLLRP